MAVKGSFATAHRPGFTAPETWLPVPGLPGLGFRVKWGFRV